MVKPHDRPVKPSGQGQMVKPRCQPFGPVGRQQLLDSCCVALTESRYQPVGPSGQTPASDTGAGPLLRDSCCVAAALQGQCLPAWSIALDHMPSHQHIGLIDCHWQWMLDWAQGIDCPAWADLLILGLGWILEAFIVLQFLCWKAAQGAIGSCA